MGTTYAALIDAASQRLAAAGVPSPQWDARVMAAHLIHCGHLDIPRREEPMPGFALAYEALVTRRAAREPLQHILGRAWFGPLELSVGPGVFVPRPETEVLADWGVRALRDAGPAPVVVDLCAGSGALGLYVAAARPDAHVVAAELSEAALAYTRTNAQGTGLEVRREDVTRPDALEDLNGAVDLVLTNPPYVPEDPSLEPEVYFDPPEAVFAGGDGMAVIGPLVPTIERLLRPGGQVGIEHDDSTGRRVAELLRASGKFHHIDHLRDLTGTPRFVTATRAAGAGV